VGLSDRRLGVFGGTFDPVHNGHLAVAEFVLGAGNLDEVLLVPAGDPWLRKHGPLASAAHRLRMAELAVESHDGLSVSRVDIDRKGETYTVDTLRELRRQYGEDAELVLVVGADSAVTMDRWKHSDRLKAMCETLVVRRAGQEWPESLREDHPAAHAVYVEGPVVDISASEIRNKLAAGESVRDMVPEAVERYIRRHGLYGTSKSDR
jgi:nicotinate-nucleotide adenylyltransferase